ncbi:hypothetical protein, conserved [Plasmodium gonderi]|uniref:F-box domain-containing protein n=1 Tax=Plasmodium gonderi TaxID=77519 RepID=A0A1Y1JH79_PLAGO|nr:hypothetical protein, conserved [Plasmodium gonderi]GAW81876.1 hypothetical protein, conserved [Plasmodium gonderi]
MVDSDDIIPLDKSKKRNFHYDIMFDKYARLGTEECKLFPSIHGCNNKRHVNGNDNRIDKSIYLKDEVLIPPLRNQKENIFQNADIVCNILSFIPFSKRWNCKLLSRSFYQAFHTKYAWDNLDVRFLDVDIFKLHFFKKYNKYFVNASSLFLSINENTSAEMIINLVIKHFTHLKDIRIYCRKENTNYIFEGVHPMVSTILNGKKFQEGKKNSCLSRDTSSNHPPSPSEGQIAGGETDEQEITQTAIGQVTYPNECNDKNDKQENRDPDDVHSKKFQQGFKDEQRNDSTNEFIDYAFEMNDFFLYNQYYRCGEKINGESEKRYERSAQKTAQKRAHRSAEDAKDEESMENVLKIIERRKIWNMKIFEIENKFENLERLVLDVKLKGDELLPFVGRLTNLKDIIISKLLYTDKLNRSQCITIFTCFIEKMKKNNVRVIQLGLFFTREYKPADYMNNENFRKIMNSRTEYISDPNKEEGDELIYILKKNHFDSLYCLWSNDLFISFDMYEQIQKFRNLQIWILPGWRALSLVKQ